MQLISRMKTSVWSGYFQLLRLFLRRSFSCATDAGNRNTLAIRTPRPHDPDVLSGKLFQLRLFLIFDGKDFPARNENVVGAALDASHGAPALVARHFMMSAAIGITDVSVVGVFCMLTAVFGCRLGNRRQGHR